MNGSAAKKRGRPGVLRWTLVVLILITLAAVAAIFIGYRRLSSDPENMATALKEVRADIALKEIRHTASRDGKPEWTLTAKSAQVQGERNRTVIEQPDVVFFLNDGGEVHLKAQKGILKIESNDLEAIGKVTVRNDAYLLRTGRLSYDHRRQRLSTHASVIIEGQRFSVRADRLTYDLNTKIATLSGNVESEIHEKISL